MIDNDTLRMRWWRLLRGLCWRLEGACRAVDAIWLAELFGRLAWRANDRHFAILARLSQRSARRG